MDLFYWCDQTCLGFFFKKKCWWLWAFLLYVDGAEGIENCLDGVCMRCVIEEIPFVHNSYTEDTVVSV